MPVCKKNKYQVGQYVRVIRGNKDVLGKVGRITDVLQLKRINGMAVNDTCKGYTRATYIIKGININEILYSFQIELLDPQPMEIDIQTGDFPIQDINKDCVKIALNRLEDFDKLIEQIEFAKAKFISGSNK